MPPPAPLHHAAVQARHSAAARLQAPLGSVWRHARTRTLLEREGNALGVDPRAIAILFAPLVLALAGPLAQVAVKPVCGWEEPALLWGQLVALPGATKTPIVKRVRKMLKESLQREAANTDWDPIDHSATAEKMHETAAEHDGVLFAIRDESVGLNKPNEVMRDMLKRCYDKDEVSRTTVSSDREGVNRTIEHAGIVFVGTIQPQPLMPADATEADAFIADGFDFRFCRFLDPLASEPKTWDDLGTKPSDSPDEQSMAKVFDYAFKRGFFVTDDGAGKHTVHQRKVKFTLLPAAEDEMRTIFNRCNKMKWEVEQANEALYAVYHSKMIAKTVRWSAGIALTRAALDDAPERLDADVVIIEISADDILGAYDFAYAHAKAHCTFMGIAERAPALCKSLGIEDDATDDARAAAAAGPSGAGPVAPRVAAGPQSLWAAGMNIIMQSGSAKVVYNVEVGWQSSLISAGVKNAHVPGVDASGQPHQGWSAATTKAVFDGAVAAGVGTTRGEGKAVFFKKRLPTPAEASEFGTLVATLKRNGIDPVRWYTATVWHAMLARATRPPSARSPAGGSARAGATPASASARQTDIRDGLRSSVKRRADAGVPAGSAGKTPRTAAGAQPPRDGVTASAEARWAADTVLPPAGGRAKARALDAELEGAGASVQDALAAAANEDAELE